MKLTLDLTEHEFKKLMNILPNDLTQKLIDAYDKSINETYMVGDKFIKDNEIYTLNNMFMDDRVNLYYSNGQYVYGKSIKVNDIYNITKDELTQLIGSYYIDDYKLMKG